MSTDVNHCGDCDTVCAGVTSGGAATCTDGKCGVACDGRLVECEGECVDTQTDPASCGSCGAACAGTCDGGVCCSAGESNCAGKCVALGSSATNCGACGKACGSGKVCLNGACASDCGAQTLCGSSCVDLTSSSTNCGICSKACAAPPSNGSAACQSSQCKVVCAANYAECTPGTCTNIKTDPANCGACGQPCGGVCSNGLCCPTGQTNCNGTCANLQTDAKNCLTCGHACATGQLCEAGSCLTDCGSLTRCGQSCANLATDAYNCRTCGTRCTPPAANGVAICSGSAGCDIKCDTNSTRCVDACCPPPPANAFASCTANKCAVQCNANYHACNATSSPCYANTDVQHCGGSCLDCRQPNATAACNGTQCANLCIGRTLSCAGTNGKPACGSWEFESQTPEGLGLGEAATWDSNAGVAPLKTSASRFYLGANSLAISFDNAGGDAGSGKHQVQVRTALCSGGQGVTLAAQDQLTFLAYFESAAGAPAFPGGDGFFEAWNGSTYVFGGSDFSVSQAGQWLEFSTNLTLAVTDIGFTFRVFNSWKGTIYLDAIRVH